MIKREGLRFLHRVTATGYQAIYFNWGMMALNKDLLSASFCKFSHMAPIDGLSRTRRKSMIDVSGGFRFESGNRLRLKGCFDGCDGEFRKADTNQKNYRKIDDRFQKANALAPHQQLLHNSDIGVQEIKTVELANGRVGYEHGNPLGFPKWPPMHEKLVVAVDVDEVLGNFLSALNEFIADRYASNHSVSEYYVYEFCKIWKCSPIEANSRVHEFFKTAYFKAGIHPIPGSQHALKRLSSFCSLSVVTSRQNAIKDHTIEWVEKHFPSLFEEIHFGNHFAFDGQSRPKSEICRSLGAQVLIDDNPRYAIECAEAGIKVLLFDYNNSYPWCKTGSASLHPLVTKVYNWQQVERHLSSCIMS